MLRRPQTLAPSSGDNSAAVGTYMTGVLGSTVTVTGAATDQRYNGEGHVTGPGTGSISLTLGTSNGATASSSNSTLNSSCGTPPCYDTFLANTTDSSKQISQEFTMLFQNTQSGSVSFDYEIFPDISGSPDFIFKAWDGAVLVSTFTTLGVTPGTTDGNATKSPLGNEASKQFIGTWSSGSPLTFTKLEFIDWPATVGVDNLKISQVPEPRGGVLFLGLVLVAAVAGAKMRRALVKP